MKWPRGFAGAGMACRIKPTGEPDLGLLASQHVTNWAGTFTRNAAAAACVDWCKSLRGRPVRGLIANSGNANACTGREGVKAVEVEAEAVAQALECSRDEVLVASTGPIGVPLPVDKIAAAVPQLVLQLGAGVEPFAGSILTTDTTIKTSSASVGTAGIMGVAKGAAMIAPNMATMLAFVATDALIDSELQPLLQDVVHRTFNRISVDACESTNDCVFLLTSELAEPVASDDFTRALEHVCADLAKQIVRDGEGSTRVVRIEIHGATDEPSGIDLAHAVAASALWRAAAYGGDPNWGRVLSALGAKDRDLDLSAIELFIGSELVFSRGEPVGSSESAAKAMDSDEFTVSCVVGHGPASVEVLCSDLSPEYVDLNAAGTS
ncbi:MAG: bifunctional glutamate N-acetyltransferase/amino-acid acetyltransferase ArgJ [Actinobacteria bacterium]|nr:bifunctional glutamate N-acetyltransferase/amino-acid acetyltransferase ArgJ [Actinomycetota bacterium]